MLDLLRGAGTAAQPPGGGWLDQHRSPAAMLCTSTQGVGLCEWDGRLGATASVSLLSATLLVLMSDQVLLAGVCLSCGSISGWRARAKLKCCYQRRFIWKFAEDEQRCNNERICSTITRPECLLHSETCIQVLSHPTRQEGVLELRAFHSLTS